MNPIIKFTAIGATVLALLGGAAFAYAQSAEPTAAPAGQTQPAGMQLHDHRGGRGGPGGPGGQVTAVAKDQLTLATPAGQAITVTLSANTQVRLVEGNVSGSLNDVAVGAQVHVRGTRAADGSVAANEIMVEPSGDEAVGRVTAVNGGTLTLSDRSGASVKVTVTSATVYQGRPDQTTAPTGASAGQFVRAYGTTQADGSLAARLVLVDDGPGRGHGPDGGQAGQGGMGGHRGHGGPCPAGDAGGAGAQQGNPAPTAQP